MSPAHSDVPFKPVNAPSELPFPTQINRDAPHWGSLYAVGWQIDAEWVETAYRRGLFPWYNEGDPVLWHSPNPRMVLALDEFHCANNLTKTLKRWARHPELSYRVTANRCFERVIAACAQVLRHGQSGTWINPQLMAAYTELHRRRRAISVEVWHGDALVAGLYGVMIGKMFFGESMFTTVTDGSKVALACWVRYLRAHGGRWIDCQQVTAHLASLGARALPRAQYFSGARRLMRESDYDWGDVCAQDNLLAAFAQAGKSSP